MMIDHHTEWSLCQVTTMLSVRAVAFEEAKEMTKLSPRLTGKTGKTQN